MPACRHQLHPDLVGAPLAPVAAPDESRRFASPCQERTQPCFCTGSPRLPVGVQSGRTAAGPNPQRRGPLHWLKTNRMLERRQKAPASSVPHGAHRVRRGRTGNFPQAWRRRSQSAVTNVGALHHRLDSVAPGAYVRRGQTRPTPEFRMALVTAGTRTMRPVSDGAYCASFRPALSLSSIRSSSRRLTI